MAHDVFVSYSSKDKITADAVCAKLESNGIRCWIAPRDVTPGLEWGESIVEAIEQSRIMVLVFSADANASPQIRREVERAVNRGVVILPLRIENVLPGRALEYFIGNVHWLDAMTPPLEKHLQHLTGTLKVLLERMRPQGEVFAAESEPPLDSQPELASAPAGSHEDWVADPARFAATAEESTKPHVATPLSIAKEQNFLPRFALRAVVSVVLAAIVLVSSWLGIQAWRRSRAVAGAAWFTRQSGTISGLYAVARSFDGRYLWVVGNNGIVLESDGSGANWVVRHKEDSTSLNSIFATIDGDRLWVSRYAYRLLISNDGGVSWSILDPSVREDGGGSSNGLKSLFGTTDAQHLWAIGSSGGAVVQSDDQGQSWRQIEPRHQGFLYTLAGTPDGKRLWAAGQNGALVQSNNGGVDFAQRSSGVGASLFSIFVAGDGNRVWIVGDNGTILASEDGGSHWSVRNSGTTQMLESIFGTPDGRHLWVVGTNGVILQSDDKGFTWTIRHSGTTEILFSIVGSRDGHHLCAVGNRGTILESDSGN
jgi:photosystem II stability/assembly factor-like uncharacterized protein